MCFPTVQSFLYGRVSIAFLPVVAFSQRSRFWLPSGQSSCVPVHPGCQHNPFDLSVSLLCLFLSILLSVHMNAWSFSSILYRLSPAENRFRDAIVDDLRLESGWDGVCQCRRVARAVNAVTPDIPSLTAILPFTGTHACIAMASEQLIT